MVLGRAVASSLAMLQGVVDGVHDGGVLVSDVHSEIFNNIIYRYKYSRREQSKREIRLPVVLLAVVCTAKLAMARLARPTALTCGESDMTKVVLYFLIQIYSNKQRIVLKKNSSE